MVGHNVLNFDHAVILKLYGVDFYEINTHDTFIMSQVLRYKRKHKHGLGGWGEELENRKLEFNNFDTYSREMLEYCVQDVRLNAAVYEQLTSEFQAVAQTNSLIAEGMRIEHDIAILNTIMKREGWNFDEEKAKTNLRSMEKKMEEIEAVIHPQLGERKVYKDKTPKTPKFKKNGDYTATTVRLLSEYLGREVRPDETEALPAGTEFQRYTMEPITLGSMDLVKDWLLERGWKPDEYQRRKVGFDWVTTGPKLTSTSLRKLGEIGEMIDDYYTLRNRASVIRGWLDTLRGGRLHGSMWTVGTPTFRCRHEVIVNLPAVNASWGRELRELFRADEGHVLVGADSSGNQLRGLCHYVGNEDFTDEVIFGDQHQRNADALNCSRPVAKSYLYAYLFGAGDAKLGQVLTGTHNAQAGKKSREDFAKSIKGLNELRKRLSQTHGRRHTSDRETDGSQHWTDVLSSAPPITKPSTTCCNQLKVLPAKLHSSMHGRRLKRKGCEPVPVSSTMTSRRGASTLTMQMR